MIKSLYDEFAKRWYRGGSIWFYSDPHFGDEESKELRTKRRLYISDEEQVERINKKIGKKDTIIFLGDICDVEFIKKIRGYKVLIVGNHDVGATKYLREKEEVELFDQSLVPESELLELKNKLLTTNLKDFSEAAASLYRKYTRVENRDNHLFDEVYEGPVMIGPKLIISHEPIDFKYAFNIHGHDHSGHNFHDNMHLNVCAELINYTPVSIKDIITSGKLKRAVDIHREAINKQAKDSLKRKK